MMVNKEVISIFVDNQANVLSRIVSFFGRRGFNIDSLTVSTTHNPGISRITIVCHVDEQELRQIITQTEKLEIVREIFVLEIKQRFDVGIDNHSGQRSRFAGELQTHLVEVIEVDMRIA